MVELDGEHYNALFQLGNGYMQLEDYPLALDWYLRALAVDEKDPAIHNRIADLYEKVGEENAAEHYRRQAQKLRNRRRKK